MSGQHAGANVPTVYLYEVEDYNRSRLRECALAFFQRSGVDVRQKAVFLKPSFVYPSASKPQVITSPVLVAAVADALVELGARRVVIGEGGTVGPARYAFEMVGMKRQSLPGAVGFAYLDEEPREPVELDPPFAVDRVPLPRSLLESDLYVSLPKLKVNLFATVTLSVKNQLGLVPKRFRLSRHDERLHAFIADLFRARPPDAVITDAVVAGEGQGPMEAQPARLGVIVASTQPLAADAVSCALMGIDPRSVEHLRLLEERGLGSLDMGGIDIVPKDVFESRRTAFARPSHELEGLSSRLRVFQGRERFCPSGCQGMLRAILDGYGQHMGWENIPPVNIVFGEPVEADESEIAALPRSRTIVYGDCARRFRRYGVFVPGCPPDYTRGLLAFWLVMRRPVSWYRDVRHPALLKSYMVWLFRRLGLAARSLLA